MGALEADRVAAAVMGLAISGVEGNLAIYMKIASKEWKPAEHFHHNAECHSAAKSVVCCMLYIQYVTKQKQRVYMYIYRKQRTSKKARK